MKKAKRFTDAEIIIIEDMWVNYVSVEAIAKKFKRSEASIRQVVSNYNFPTRQTRVSRAMQKAPSSVRTVLFSAGEEEFMLAYGKWQKEQAIEEVREKMKKSQERELEIHNILQEAKGIHDRNDAIHFLRDKGLTLERIGNTYNITRERVRQICCTGTTHPKSRERNKERDKRIIASYKNTKSCVKTARNLKISAGTVTTTLEFHNIPRTGRPGRKLTMNFEKIIRLNGSMSYKKIAKEVKSSNNSVFYFLKGYNYRKNQEND
jgi:transposase